MSDNDTQLDTHADPEPYQDFGSLDAAETVHTVDSDAAQEIADYNAGRRGVRLGRPRRGAPR